MTGQRRRDPEELTIEDAVHRWLDRKRSDCVESTIGAYKGRLRLFWEWCDEIGVERVGGLQPLDIDEYNGVRSRSCQSVTLENEMKTLQQFLGYLDNIDAVDSGLPDAVRMPDVDKEDRSDETVLAEDSAFALLDVYRTSGDLYGTRPHALLELAWFTAARRGGLRAIDVRDVDFENGAVDFVHRPETGTPLKNKMFGQRSVSLPEESAEAIGAYVRGRRRDQHDEEGRQPLLPSTQGRPAATTVAAWCYRLTQPCVHSECPHGKERPSCQYRSFNHASKCPSSRSPHPIRSGSITWQLNRGLPPEVVAGRVNASIETIRWHYDWATEKQRWQRLHEHRQQRAEYVTNLTIES